MSHALAGTRTVGLLLAFFLILAPPISGQTGQRVSLQVSALTQRITQGVTHSNFFDDSEDPNVRQSFFLSGGEAQLRYSPGRFSIGVGLQVTTGQYPILVVEQGEGIQVVGNETRTDVGPYVEPRIVFWANDRVAGYGAARVGALAEKLNRDDGNKERFTKTYANVGAGLLLALGGRVNADFNFTVGQFGAHVNYTGRIGLAIGLGG